MSATRYDVVVIGGGPAGSCAATYLARAGRRVLVLERERFPRFHVGESLLPYNGAIFDELGVSGALREAGFPVKRGAQFHLADGAKGVAVRFRDGVFNRHSEALQVERARFDDILLRHAGRCGAEVIESFEVSSAEEAGRGRVVRGRGADGVERGFEAAFVVDATGRANLTGDRERLREADPELRKISIFAHYTGVRLDPEPRAGDTVIVRLEKGWFWLIPLDVGTGRVSVGLVLDLSEYSAAGAKPEDVFGRAVEGSAFVKGRLAGAGRATPLQVTADWSYRNRSFHSRRLVRVGDAAGFVDPIFSSGVLLAMRSAREAALAVDAALRAGDDGAARFAAYQRRVTAALDLYRGMATRFYTRPFVEVFLEPRNKWHVVSAVNAVLAGETDGGWKIRWRLKLFYLIVALQARWPLVPRLRDGSEPS